MDLSKLPSDFDLSNISFECSFKHPVDKTDKNIRNGYYYDFTLLISNFVFKGKNYFFERTFKSQVVVDKTAKWGVKFYLKTCVSFGQHKDSIYNYFILQEPKIENHKVYLDSCKNQYWKGSTEEQLFNTLIVQRMTLEDRQIILPALLAIYTDVFSFIPEKEIVAFSLQDITSFLNLELERAQAEVEKYLDIKENLRLLSGE